MTAKKMRFFISTFLFSCAAGMIAFAPSDAQLRGIGGGALVLDDYSGHTLIYQTPRIGDPSYSTWGSSLHARLPIPPTDNAEMGFVGVGPATQPATPYVLIWNASNTGGGTGGVQGEWIPQDMGTLGFALASGTVGSLAGFNGTSSVGDIDLTGDVTTSGSSTTTIHNTSAAGSHIIAALTTNGGILTNNTSGNATTATTATNFSGSLSGDVTGTQSATAINNSSAAGGHIIAALTANAGTLTNNTSGNAAGFTGSLSGDVTGTQGATAINNSSAAGGHIIAALTANAGTLTNNTSGNAATATSATSFSGSLSGDVTGTQGATAINNSSAAGGHIISALTANAGTLSNSTTGTASNVTGTVGATHGGTGQSTYNTGDMLYASNATTISKLSIGTVNQVLSVSAGIPTWINNGATITNNTTAASIATNQDNYTINPSAALIRITNASAGTLNITGINSSGMTDGRMVTIVNVSSEPIMIINQGSSTAGNQFLLPGNANILIGQWGTATFVFDALTSPPGNWELASTN